MNNEKIDKVVAVLRDSSNILITINKNPNVDEVAAAIALSFILEKLDKFTTTIFTGKIPPAAEFLNPEATFETNIEILRDFIVTIDKNKVDRLRYKEEGDVVNIYLTPYKTTLGKDDLTFANGDYNVDLLIAIGAINQEDLDETITTTASRILHDAKVLSINKTNDDPAFANLTWYDSTETSYCEMVTDLAELLGEDTVPENVATALLTGIISETEQFKNGKTTAKSMQIAAKLMGYGANQQLISIKLEEAGSSPVATPKPVESVNELSDQEVVSGINEKLESQINKEATRVPIVEEPPVQPQQVAPPGSELAPPVVAPIEATPIVQPVTPVVEPAPKIVEPPIRQPEVIPAPTSSTPDILNDLANYKSSEEITPGPVTSSFAPPPLPQQPSLSGTTPLPMPPSLDPVEHSPLDPLARSISTAPVATPAPEPEMPPASPLEAPIDNPFLASAQGDLSQTISGTNISGQTQSTSPQEPAPSNQFKIPG